MLCSGAGIARPPGSHRDAGREGGLLFSLTYSQNQTRVTLWAVTALARREGNRTTQLALAPCVTGLTQTGNQCQRKKINKKYAGAPTLRTASAFVRLEAGLIKAQDRDRVTVNICVFDWFVAHVMLFCPIQGPQGKQGMQGLPGIDGQPVSTHKDTLHPWT